MKFGNCSTCNRPYLKTGAGDQCPNCLREEQKNFEKVVEYLREKPRASLFEICEETGVSESLVLKFIRLGKLQLADGANYLTCSMCGQSIREGRLCASCSEKVSSAVKRPLPSGSGPRTGADRPVRPHVSADGNKESEKTFWYTEYLSNAPQRRRGNRR